MPKPPPRMVTEKESHRTAVNFLVSLQLFRFPQMRQADDVVNQERDRRASHEIIRRPERRPTVAAVKKSPDESRWAGLEEVAFPPGNSHIETLDGAESDAIQVESGMLNQLVARSADLSDEQRNAIWRIAQSE